METKDYISLLMDKRASAVENFVNAYLLEHPELSIDNIELVQQEIRKNEDDSITYRWYCRPRKESEVR